MVSVCACANRSIQNESCLRRDKTIKYLFQDQVHTLRDAASCIPAQGSGPRQKRPPTDLHKFAQRATDAVHDRSHANSGRDAVSRVTRGELS